MSISSTWSILRWKKTNQIEGWFEVNLDLSSLVGAAVFNQIYSQWIIYDWKFLGIYLLFTFSLRALVAHKFYLHYVSGRFWFMLRTHFKCLRRLFFVFGNLLFFVVVVCFCSICMAIVAICIVHRFLYTQNDCVLFLLFDVSHVACCAGEIQIWLKFEKRILIYAIKTSKLIC